MFTLGLKGREKCEGLLRERRKLPSPAHEDPRLDFAEAVAAGSLSDFKGGQAAAARAVAKAKELGVRQLAARARIDEGLALRHLGEAARAKATLEQAERIFAEAGDRMGMAKAMNNIAMVLFDQGDHAGTRARFEQALAISRQIGDRTGEARALNNLAVVLQAQGVRRRSVRASGARLADGS